MAEDAKRREEVAELQPGDKIYKLFKHDKVMVRGKEEAFLIKISKLKRK